MKRSGDRAWVAVDGGISDNARPQLYDARYTAVVATRMDAPTSGDASASPASTASRATC